MRVLTTARTANVLTLVLTSNCGYIPDFTAWVDAVPIRRLGDGGRQIEGSRYVAFNFGFARCCGVVCVAAWSPSVCDLNKPSRLGVT